VDEFVVDDEGVVDVGVAAQWGAIGMLAAEEIFNISKQFDYFSMKRDKGLREYFFLLSSKYP